MIELLSDVFAIILSIATVTKTMESCYGVQCFLETVHWDQWRMVCIRFVVVHCEDIRNLHLLKGEKIPPFTAIPHSWPPSWTREHKQSPSLAQRIWIFISSPGTARIGSSLTNWNGSERIGKTFTQLHEADGFGLNSVDWRQFTAFRKI